MYKGVKLFLGLFFLILPILIFIFIKTGLLSILSDFVIIYGGVSWMISSVILFFFQSKRNKWISITLFLFGMLWFLLIVNGLNMEI